MKEIKIFCDKCKQVIRNEDYNSINYEVEIKVSGSKYSWNLDFCPNCYNEFLKSMNNFLNSEE